MSPAILCAVLLAAAQAEPASSSEASAVSAAEVPGRPAAPAKPAKPGRLTVELRDAQTGQAAAGRVRVSVGEQEVLPAGATPAGGGFFLVDGVARLAVPAGNCRLQVDAGPMRLPYDRPVEVAPGGTEERTIYLERPGQFAGFERAGWAPVDPLYSGGTLPAEKAWLAVRAAGIAAAGLDAPELSAAKPPRWARGAALFTWRIDADPRLGSRCALAGGGSSADFYVDCGRPRRVNPWRTIVPWRPELREFYGSLSEATVGLAPRMYYELLAGAPVGGFELDGSAAAEKLWFAILSEGWRVPAVAGSRGTLSGGECPVPRMLLRSTGGAAGPATLVAALRSGRSTLSFGPFCFLAIDKAGPGEELALEEGDRRILVRALADTERRAEIARVELWGNGKVLRSWTADPGQTVAELEMVAPLDEPGWVLAKCYQRIRATDEIKPGPGVGPETVALTNPIWIVPRNYRASLSPVKTQISCRVVDAASGQPVPAQITSRHSLEDLGGLAPNPLSGIKVFDCPDGSFRVKLPANGSLTIRTPDHQPREVVLFEELGLAAFAQRLAAMPPEKAVEELSSSKTLQTLRDAMGRLELTVKLEGTKGLRH